jgi:hypothetical protein
MGDGGRWSTGEFEGAVQELWPSITMSLVPVCPVLRLWVKVVINMIMQSKLRDIITSVLEVVLCVGRELGHWQDLVCGTCLGGAPTTHWTSSAARAALNFTPCDTHWVRAVPGGLVGLLLGWVLEPC